VKACPNGALKEAGFWMDAEEITNQIDRYSVFYKNSDNGGVTISGGDPMFQPKFSLEVLEACEKRGIHTAIETSAFAPEDVFTGLIRHVRLLLADIKHMDPVKHKEGTGVSNELILKNLRNWLEMESRPRCVIRIPLIPGFNDDEENISETCRFVKEIGLEQIDLLPFNILPTSKYSEMGKNWEFTGVESQSGEKLAQLSAVVTSCGLKTTIGGLW
jgi:pyruvate formate lyase activating enzyme